MAPTGALCQTLLAATGLANTSLRAVIAGLLGSDYRPGQMTYDLEAAAPGRAHPAAAPLQPVCAHR